MPRDLVVLHELANIGAGHAATALSQLFSRPVGMTPPKVFELTLAEAIEYFQPDEHEVSAALLRLEGALAGVIALLTSDSEEMLKALGMEPGIEADVIAECGNIVAAKVADAIGSMTMMDSRPSTPAAGVAPYAGVIELVLQMTAQSEPFVVAFSELTIGDALLAHLMFFPEASSVEQIEALA